MGQSWPLMWQSNLAVIKLRGTYAAWARRSEVSYHEVLIFYSLHELKACTQKQICESYILPKQTVNNIVQAWKKAGYLEFVPGTDGRTRLMRLTPLGRQYEQQVMGPLYALEDKAVAEMGTDELHQMNALLLRFGQILERELLGQPGPAAEPERIAGAPGKEEQSSHETEQN